MKAVDSDLKSLIEGVKQFMIPVYQRSFSWAASDQRTKKMTVEKMWNDISNLMDVDNSIIHFFGSIVTMPVSTGASEVSKFIVIDGQQRLISSFMLLAAIRDVAKKLKFKEGSKYLHFVEKLENEYIFNRYRETEDRYKLLPTIKDRMDFFYIIDARKIGPSNRRLVSAYYYFKNKIDEKIKSSKDSEEMGIYLESLENTLLKRFKIVDVKLDLQDDPHDVFESLNYTGVALSNWDLAKNYILMHYKNSEEQEMVYSNSIQKIENNIENYNDDFLRDFIEMNGIFTTSRDIYTHFKVAIPEGENPDDTGYWDKKLDQIIDASSIYDELIHHEKIEDPIIREMIYFTKDILKTKTHFPLLMKLFKIYYDGIIDVDQMRMSLKMIAGYLLKAYFSDYGLKGLNRVFPNIVKDLDGGELGSLRDALKKYDNFTTSPDEKLEDRLSRHNFVLDYKLAKYLLFSLEQSKNKEAPSFDKIQLEHIMPQTLNEKWKKDLGDDWDNIFKTYLYRLGNLTITGYNQTLGNRSFDEKKNIENGYKNSSIRMTKELLNYEKWGQIEILYRGKRVALEIAKMWAI